MTNAIREKMKLFEVTNGWIGNSYVRCLVIASNEEEAIKLTSSLYKKEAKDRQYANTYFEGLKAEILCEDTSSFWVGDITSE